MNLSPGGPILPNNSRQERWYRAVEQEEMYLHPTYPSLEAAWASLAGYTDLCNERKPREPIRPCGTIRQAWCIAWATRADNCRSISFKFRLPKSSG